MDNTQAAELINSIKSKRQAASVKSKVKLYESIKIEAQPEEEENKFSTKLNFILILDIVSSSFQKLKAELEEGNNPGMNFLPHYLEGLHSNKINQKVKYEVSK